MHRKRTTAPDGIRGVIGPPTERPVKGNEPRERLTPAMAARVALELARERRRLSHRPTMAQLRTMARFGGRAPSSYRLDRAVNWLPESLPLEFPHGASGLCFAHPGGDVVVLPDGCGFALLAPRAALIEGPEPRRPPAQRRLPASGPSSSLGGRAAASRRGDRRAALTPLNGDQPMLKTVTPTSTRAQLADTDEAIIAFAVTFREPDRDVHQHDLAWWLAQEERLEIRSELAAHGLL